MKNQCEWHRIKEYGVPTFALVWVGVAICGCYWPCIWCWTWSHYESARWAVEKGTRSGYEQEQTDTAKMNWNLCLSLSSSSTSIPQWPAWEAGTLCHGATLAPGPGLGETVRGHLVGARCLWSECCVRVTHHISRSVTMCSSCHSICLPSAIFRK